MKKVFKNAMGTALAALASFALVFTSCNPVTDKNNPNGSDPEEPVLAPSKTIEGYNIVLVDQAANTSSGYSSVSEALAKIPSSSESEYGIYLLPGEYSETYLHYNGSAIITIAGITEKEYGSDVIIIGRGSNMGKEKGRELLEVEGTGNLILENLTLKSDLSRQTVSGDAQAEVLGFDSTGYVAAYNCSFLSHQDTMRTTGKGWFYKCHIEGDTDFIWMESLGIVALYEECEIVSVYDEYATTHASYILAPRANVANTIGKGAVIYNSTVVLENDTNFLFRNPWGTNKDYYNQGAFVGCKFEGSKSIEAAVAKSDAMGTADQQYIGWKLDEAASAACPSKKSSIGTISADVLASEYNGRRAILNRNYSVKFGQFAADAENTWDIDAFITARGWNVTEDTSRTILEGETAPSVVVYDLTKQTVEGITEVGFKKEANKSHHVGTTGNTITVPVTGPCTVAVTGYYQGSGTIAAGTQGIGTFSCNNGSTTKFLTSEYVVYKNDVSEVVITATGTSYLTKITVTYGSAITFKPVELITITAADSVEELAGKKTLQFAAAVNPSNATNAEYVWSVSDEEAASIDAAGLLTAANVSEEKTISVIATARDENAVAGTYTLKIVPANENSVDLTWLAGTDNSFAGKSSNTDLATASACVPSLTGDGITWAYNYSKNGGPCNSGVTLTATDADPKKGEWYIEYPVNNVTERVLKVDQLKIDFGNAGTDNFRVYLTFVDEDGNETVIFDKDDGDKTATCNPRKISYTFTIEKEIPAGKTGKIRLSIHGYQDGKLKQALTGKSPTWGKTVVSCEVQ